MTTLDFLIVNQRDLMAFICYCGFHILKQKDCEFMHVYAKLKFKMKISYDGWSQGVQFKRYILDQLKLTMS